jgi:hypothetical protein
VFVSAAEREAWLYFPNTNEAYSFLRLFPADEMRGAVSAACPREEGRQKRRMGKGTVDETDAQASLLADG